MFLQSLMRALMVEHMKMAGAIWIIGIDRLDARFSDCSSCSLRCEGGECFNLREFGPPLLNEQARLDNESPGCFHSFVHAKLAASSVLPIPLYFAISG
jgi:hypothetical protein